MSKPVPLCSHIMTHRNGKTCGIPASRGSKYCYHHDPATRERQPLRAASARVQPLDSIPNIQRELTDIINLLLLGKLDGRRAGRMLRSVELAIRAHEIRLNPFPKAVAKSSANRVSSGDIEELENALNELEALLS